VPIRERDGDELEADLWDDARLYEYSPLNRRPHIGAQPRQVGFAPGR
jgi:hypothetical protein